MPIEKAEINIVDSLISYQFVSHWYEQSSNTSRGKKENLRD